MSRHATIPFPGTPRRPPAPRVAPGSLRELGAVNATIAGVLGLAGGGRPQTIMTTLGKDGRRFRSWLRFAANLMPFGQLPRRDVELVVLRVSVLCGSDYEWHQHVALGRRAGLTDDEIVRTGVGADAAGWTDRQRALLVATEQLVSTHGVPDDAYAALVTHLDESELLELLFLVGNYVLVAGAVNTLGVRPEVEERRP